ncbi:MAG TPA: alpha/beta fold hydrolase [Gemmatimonadales bacterium]|nr:alpha/beta fold hydrolase [Gemmatimonadales bacterium]
MRWLKRLAVVVLAVAAAALLDRERRPRPTYQAEWLRAGDATVRAVRGGRGDTTVVLIHGYAESLISWRPVFDRLAERYRVLAFDVPGFGVSDKPDAAYDLPTQLARLDDLLAHATGGPLVLVGHSMGGELAAALALRHPDRVVALVLVSPAGFGLSAALDSMGPGTRGVVSWAAAAAAAGIVPVHDPGWLAEPPDRAGYLPAGDTAYRRALRRVLEQFDFAALRDSVPALRQPTLLVWGRQDPTIPFAIGERLAATLPCVRFAPLAATLHRPNITDPDTVSALALDFLRRPTCAP